MSKNSNLKESNENIFPTDSSGNIIPGTYNTKVGEVKIKKIEKAKHYDVISMARAMNDNFAQQTQQLFEPEVVAVQEAINSGIYVSWRLFEELNEKHDCQRVNSSSRCFCSHLLDRHNISKGAVCTEKGCRCRSFQHAPSRPEEFGEFWLRKRKDFDPSAYRMKCVCKHTHEEHECFPSPYRCKSCACSGFSSASVCAACDKRWELHGTFFETQKERLDAGRQVGKDWLPFSELPALCDIAVTGVDNPQIETIQDAIPPEKRQNMLQDHSRSPLPPP